MAPRWSTQEEAALRVGVDKHGKGKWKAIWKDPAFNEILNSRSNKDLKDKWKRIVKANNDTAAALANAYQVLGIARPDGPPAALVGDASPPKDVDDDVDVDDDEDLEDADEKFDANFGKSLQAMDSFQTAFFYSRGIWCRYKEKTQELLRVAFRDDIPYVKQKMSGDRVTLIDIYRMSEYRLWKVGPKAKPVGWMDTDGEMHFPGHLDRNEFTVVLKDEEETFVSIPKVITALNEMDLEKLDPKMFEIASGVLHAYEALYEDSKGEFVAYLESYANREFLTLLGTLV